MNGLILNNLTIYFIIVIGIAFLMSYFIFKNSLKPYEQNKNNNLSTRIYKDNYVKLGQTNTYEGKSKKYQDYFEEEDEDTKDFIENYKKKGWNINEH